MSIKLLPWDVSSQIAAGEIIDRPASIVKELIENSLDAGATKIYLNIIKGGMQSIRIYDNGCGIKKNELLLSLQHYTTSKIFSIKDLQNISSFGFRGEALASISSVSRFILISKTYSQNLAWKICVEGKNIISDIHPISHPFGTTIEVADLFFNFPVRRKFLKNENIEFSYICKVVKKIALSNFNVLISLTHNNKLICFYSVKNINNQYFRIKDVLGFEISNFINIKNYEKQLSLSGWIEKSNIFSKKNNQYFYINNRIIFHKLISHAINQAYYHADIKNFKKYSYVLFFKIIPNQIDINVHPKKSEVHFLNPILVHNFIVNSILKHLIKQKNIEKNYETKKINTDKNNYINKILFLPKKKIITNNIYNIKILSILYEKYAIIQKMNDIFLFSLYHAKYIIKNIEFNLHSPLKFKNLLIPIKLKISHMESKKICLLFKKLNFLGFYFNINDTEIVFNTIPILFTFDKKNLKKLIFYFLNFLKNQKTNISLYNIKKYLIYYYMKNKKKWNIEEGLILLEKIKKYNSDLLMYLPNEIIKKINIKNLINNFKNYDK